MWVFAIIHVAIMVKRARGQGGVEMLDPRHRKPARVAETRGKPLDIGRALWCESPAPHTELWLFPRVEPLDETATTSNVPAGHRSATWFMVREEPELVTKSEGRPMLWYTSDEQVPQPHMPTCTMVLLWATVNTVELARAKLDPKVWAKLLRLRLRGEAWWASPSECLCCFASRGQHTRGGDPRLCTMNLVSLRPHHLIKSSDALRNVMTCQRGVTRHRQDSRLIESTWKRIKHLNEANERVHSSRQCDALTKWIIVLLKRRKTIPWNHTVTSDSAHAKPRKWAGGPNTRLALQCNWRHFLATMTRQASDVCTYLIWFANGFEFSSETRPRAPFHPTVERAVLLQNQWENVASMNNVVPLVQSRHTSGSRVQARLNSRHTSAKSDMGYWLFCGPDRGTRHHVKLRSVIATRLILRGQDKPKWWIIILLRSSIDSKRL